MKLFFNLNLFPLVYGKEFGFRLAHLDPNVFKELKNLEELHLDRLKLTSIEPGLFSGLCNLKTLSLSENQLNNLEPGLFSGLYNLRELKLSGNQLKNLHEEVFRDLQKLEYLYFPGNKFAYLSMQSQVFRPLVNLKRLGLDDQMLVNSEDLAKMELRWSYDGVRGYGIWKLFEDWRNQDNHVLKGLQSLQFLEFLDIYNYNKKLYNTYYLQ